MLLQLKQSVSLLPQPEHLSEDLDIHRAEHREDLIIGKTLPEIKRGAAIKNA